MASHCRAKVSKSICRLPVAGMLTLSSGLPVVVKVLGPHASVGPTLVRRASRFRTAVR